MSEGGSTRQISSHVDGISQIVRRLEGLLMWKFCKFRAQKIFFNVVETALDFFGQKLCIEINVKGRKPLNQSALWVAVAQE